MCSICTFDQQHNHHSHPLHKKSLRAIDIPPRKLLARGFFSKYNNVEDDEESDPYSSDEFRMYEFKVRKCARSRSHDWTDCPFAHPNEKARRRDPRKFNYSGTVCSEFRKGQQCSKGDNCELSHGVFECWLHPSRYRTEACKDGKNCKRKVCFFAHSTHQLRTPPLALETTLQSPEGPQNFNANHCCGCCHTSPISTLINVAQASPPISPPLNSRDFYGGGMIYKDSLIGYMDGMSVSDNASSPVSVKMNLPWVDVNFGVNLSPGSSKIWSGGSINSSRFKHGEYSGTNNNNESKVGTDFGWVNDLLI